MSVVETKFGDVVFSKAVPFILGLVFSFQLIESAFLNILVTNLSDDVNMRLAVVVVILQEGTSEFLQIFFAVWADAYTGRFLMLTLSSVVSVAGLSLTLVSASKKISSIFYLALLLMSMSQAAKEVTLKAFLSDQLVPRDREASEDEEESAKKSCKFWMICASFLAKFVALFVASLIDSLVGLSTSLLMVMGISFMCFLCGKKFYNCPKPTGSSLSDVRLVIRSALKKRNVEGDPSIEIPPDVFWLRWLDRAAADEEHEINEPMNTAACSVEQVKGVKFLMKMLPMWATFLIFCLVSSSGRTFFLEEAESITGDNFPILLFLILPDLVESSISRTCVFISKKLGYENENTTQIMKLVRIGLGMVCCVFCCFFAGINAVYRLHPFSENDHTKLHNYTSLLRLLPQFYLLQLMKRLSTDGLEQFFDSQVSDSISRYGPPFGECVIGVGKFVSVIVILCLSRIPGWIEDDVEDSHLERYYFMLAGFSSVNCLLYCLVAQCYGDDTFLSREDDNVEGAGADVVMGAGAEVEMGAISGERSSFGDDRKENVRQQFERSLLPRGKSFRTSHQEGSINEQHPSLTPDLSPKFHDN